MAFEVDATPILTYAEIAYQKRVVKKADPADVMREQLEYLLEHVEECREDTEKCPICQDYLMVGARLMGKFGEPFGVKVQAAQETTPEATQNGQGSPVEEELPKPIARRGRPPKRA